MTEKMNDYYIKKKRCTSGFTLIELLVVMLILGVLVLLGVPRMAGYTQRAELRRIQHDVKVMEGKMDEAFNTEPGISEEWDENAKDLNLLVIADLLYEREGVAKNIDKVHYPNKDTGPEKMKMFSLLNSEGDSAKPSDYKIVPEKFKREIGTQLSGTFYVNKEGKVYYEHDKPLTRADNQEAECLAPTPESLDYEFDHKTGTIVKYHGDLEHLVIPGQFKVDEVCYPVVIIGRGAFAQGGFKSVIVPEGVEKIEEEAFNGNELEKIELPSTITEIGDNAFSGNGLTEEDDVIIRNDEGSVDLTDTGLEGSADFVGDDIIINTGGSGSGGSGSGGSGSGGSGSGGSGSGGSGSGGSGSGGSGGGTGSSGSRAPSSNPGGNGSTSGKQNGNIVSNGTITIDKENGVIKDYSGSDKNVTIPDKIIVDGEDVIIEEVEEAAYQGKGLKSVEMPTGLKRIEDYAFAGNQLIAAWIPDTVEHVGKYAFAYNEVSNGRKSKSTIQNIEIKGVNYINDLDDEGNIAKDVPGVNLLDYVFVSSNHKYMIDLDEYKPVGNVKQLSTDSTIRKSSSHTVSWSPVNNWGLGSEGYRLEYRVNDNDEYRLLSNIKSNRTNYSHLIGFNSGYDTIQYRVRADNGYGHTNWIESDVYDVKGDTLSDVEGTKYTITATGIYELFVRGGHGGRGGNWRANNYGGATESGSPGSPGQVYSGRFNLKKGDVLEIKRGRNGGSPGTKVGSGNGGSFGYGGYGGGESSVKVNGEVVLSAKGGQGGQGATYWPGHFPAKTGRQGEGKNYIDDTKGTKIELSASGKFAIRRIE